MTDQPVAPEPAPALVPKPKHAHNTAPHLHGLMKVARDLGGYALALAVFVITAHWTLNPVAAGYADKLFTLALVIIRINNPPAPPTAPAA